MRCGIPLKGRPYPDGLRNALPFEPGPVVLEFRKEGFDPKPLPIALQFLAGLAIAMAHTFQEGIIATAKKAGSDQHDNKSRGKRAPIAQSPHFALIRRR